jgi:O-antigen ligase
MVGTASPAARKFAVHHLNSIEAPFFGPKFSYRLVFIMAFLLTVSHLARPFERILVGYRIPLVLCFIGIVVVLVSRPLEVLSSRIVQFAVALGVWMLICGMFGIWYTGSIYYLQTYFLLLLPYMFLMAAAPQSFNHVLTLMWTTAAGTAISIMTGAQETANRLSSAGTFGNSGELALVSGVALPLGLTFALKIKSSFIRYPVMALIAGFFLRTIALTATRAGMLAIICIGAIYFWRSNLMQRMMLMLGAVIATMVMIATLPAATLQRLSTVFDSFDDGTAIAQARKDEAAASAAERRELINDAFQIIRTNPLFGAGPGNYGVYRNTYFKRADGRPKRIFPSHNTALQVASENGIIGLALYVGFFVCIWKTLQAARRNNGVGMHPDWERGQMILTALEGALVFFVFDACFITSDKYAHPFLLGGLAVAMNWISTSYVRQAAVARAAAQDVMKKSNTAFEGDLPSVGSRWKRQSPQLRFQG